MVVVRHPHEEAEEGRRCGIAIGVGISILLLSCASPTAESGVTGTVVDVIDGDSLKLLSSGVEVEVRLQGIDCPELDQDFGERARTRLSQLTEGQSVRWVQKGTDRYGRTLADVYVGDRNSGHVLLSEGLAWHFIRYSDDELMAGLEQDARSEGRGLWSRRDPIPPWDFRQGDRSRAGREAQPADGLLHGNRKSRVYHQPACANYSCKNCIVAFQNAAEAQARGFRPAGCCHPRASRRN